MRFRVSGGSLRNGESAALMEASNFWALGDLLRFRSLEGRFLAASFTLLLDDIVERRYLWLVEAVEAARDDSTALEARRCYRANQLLNIRRFVALTRETHPSGGIPINVLGLACAL